MSELNPIEKKDFTSLRILLAEGDQINLAVIKHLLKKAGCTFDLASNRSEILDKVNQSDYDLIIIDLDHNSIDAIHTASKIRSNSNSKISQLLLLGITSIADVTSFKKYSDAGVNSYVLRPVKLKDLTDALDAITINELKPDSTEAKSILNLNMLYATCGNPEIVNNILRLFITQTPDNVSQLDEFIRNKNWTDFGTLSHNMKSTYSLIGLPEIKKKFDEIENDCASNVIDIPKFEKYLSEIKEVNVKIIAEINKILQFTTA
ncbi:MAG TPA: response regulator [Cyclobacteriaceae bacterium]